MSKLVCCTVTLTKLRARLSHPTEQRADLAAAHPPPEITYADSKLPECVYICVPSGNAYQAAHPALTSYGAESRPSSSQPATLLNRCYRYGGYAAPYTPSDWG